MHLEVINESYMHSVPRDAETHFKVIIATEAFEGVKLLERHRAVNTLLAEQLQTGVHALSIKAKTALQWEKQGGSAGVAASPACMGGFGK